MFRGTQCMCTLSGGAPSFRVSTISCTYRNVTPFQEASAHNHTRLCGFPFPQIGGDPQWLSCCFNQFYIHYWTNTQLRPAGSSQGKNLFTCKTMLFRLCLVEFRGGTWGGRRKQGFDLAPSRLQANTGPTSKCILLAGSSEPPQG